MKKAYKLNLLTYNKDKTFGPDRKITREEVAVILDKLSSIIKAEDKFENKLKYDDASKWALSAIDSVIKRVCFLAIQKKDLTQKRI